MLRARSNPGTSGICLAAGAPGRRVFWVLCASGAASEGEGSPSSSSPGGASDPLSRRVLVVEDDWLIAAQIESYLAAAGFDVTGIAPDSSEAMRLARTAPPDMALMDIRLLGDLDGIAIAKELWRTMGLRCLFVSANIEADAKTRAAEARPLGWLPKPFTEAELIDAVSRSFDELGLP